MSKKIVNTIFFPFLLLYFLLFFWNLFAPPDKIIISTYFLKWYCIMTFLTLISFCGWHFSLFYLIHSKYFDRAPNLKQILSHLFKALYSNAFFLFQLLILIMLSVDPIINPLTYNSFSLYDALKPFFTNWVSILIILIMIFILNLISSINDVTKPSYGIYFNLFGRKNG